MDKETIQKIRKEINTIDREVSEHEHFIVKRKSRKNELEIALKVYGEMNGNDTLLSSDGTPTLSRSQEIQLLIKDVLKEKALTSGEVVAKYASMKGEENSKVRNLVYQMLYALAKNGVIKKSAKTGKYSIIEKTPSILEGV